LVSTLIIRLTQTSRHRAIGNIISNALAYINEPQGFVHIVVDDIPSLLPPSGYADLSLTKNVSIQIQDSGIGMDREYLQYHYFRPMKKENELRPGSGLSVHIARRLIATLGGNIAVSSQTGKVGRARPSYRSYADERCRPA
jgi:signal transduction histidine kinase